MMRQDIMDTFAARRSRTARTIVDSKLLAGSPASVSRRGAGGLDPNHYSSKSRVGDEMGLHLRRASKIVEVAQQFESQILLCRDGAAASAKSILDMLTLGAAHGTVLVIDATGPDAGLAVHRIAAMLEADGQ